MNEIESKVSKFCDTLAKNKMGNYVARRAFFYRHGRTSQDMADKIVAAIPGVIIIKHWERYTAFRGGASVANQSHWGVEFQVS